MKFAQQVFIGATFSLFVSGSIEVYGQDKPIFSIEPLTLVEDCYFPPGGPPPDSDCGGSFYYLDMDEDDAACN